MFQREGINSQQSHQSQVIQSNQNKAIHKEFKKYKKR